MDLFKYLKTQTPGLGIYIVEQDGKKFIRVQFGQSDKVSSKFKGKKARLFPVTDACLKEATKFYKTLKPWVPKTLTRSEAAIIGSKSVTDFVTTKKGYTTELVDFIQKNSSEPKYNVRGGVNKLFNDGNKS